MVPMIKRQIASLKKPAATKLTPPNGDGGESADTPGSASETSGESDVVLERLDKLERMVQEMNQRLKALETHLAPPKP
jgi:hypothetical protein